MELSEAAPFFPSSITGFSGIEDLMYLFPLGGKTPTISKNEKCRFLSILRILAKSISNSSVSHAINRLEKFVLEAWLFGSDLLLLIAKGDSY